ncbi:MAG: RluA family pseudouridine synthase, partial [bacterium]|nr:RluA family pseudouridine synthase [bacterium]
RKLGYDSDFGFHPVHRLDRQTSGVILFACTSDVFRHFSHQFENRTVEKQYIALLHGNLREDTESIWTYPLGLKSGGRSNPKGSGSKQAASTRYRVLEHSKHYTLTECEPLTGRKHQIRRHAKLSGHPVVGDARYGSVRAVKFLKTNHGFDRQALHAVSLSIQPPDSSEKITLRTVQIPDAIQTLFQNDQP